MVIVDAPSRLPCPRASDHAARATANFYLVPGTAGVLAWLLLGETLTALTVLGLAVSSVGCWLVGRR